MIGLLWITGRKSKTSLAGVHRNRGVGRRGRNRKIRGKGENKKIRASFTVEASFVLPLALFAILIFLGFFYVLQTEIGVTQAISYTARHLACAYGTVENRVKDYEGIDGAPVQQNQKKIKKGLSKAGGILTARAMMTSYLKKHGCWTDCIRGKAAGIYLTGSSMEGDYVDLRAHYYVNLPISFFGLRQVPVQVRVQARKWTGYREGQEEEAEEGKVYVTQYGTAYHKSASCRYLDLSVHAVSETNVKNLRNKDGGKYYPCSCYKKESGQVFITDYGVEYHSNSGCGDLKRTVYLVDRKDAGSRHPCRGCCSS